MAESRDWLWSPATWQAALEKFGAATQLTVSVFGSEGIVAGPFHSTPLREILVQHGFDPGIETECASRCLQQERDRRAIVVASPHGIAVVGTSLVLEGRVVGATVAAYALVDFCNPSAIEHLAREAKVPFRDLWEVARAQSPIAERRLMLQGELLQALGDAILRESDRTRRSESTVADMAEDSIARDDFLAVLSHELRNPLTPILAWARILKRSYDPANSQAAAEVIERNALMQTRLVDDLLELTRAKRGRMSLDVNLQDLNALISASIEDTREDAKTRGITLSLAEADQPLLANVDVERVEQIFRNLLSNALKFTPKGGRISVVASAEVGSAVVRFKDSGQGIASDFVPFVFDAFRQQEQGTRRQYSGLGIGLALVKELTELHGGQVELSSEGLGRGTEVTVRFPLIKGDAPLLPAPTSGSLPDLRGIRLLVVDDTYDTRTAVGMLLKDSGASVHLASDGIEGLELVGQYEFDVVLCDLRMPLMDGFEFLDALRGTPSAAVPVIAVSGFASSSDHLRTQAAGFSGHLNKPFDEIRLAAAIRAAMARHLNPAPAN